MRAAKISETIAISLMMIFIAGPDVSLSGSPTVSPQTDALQALSLMSRTGNSRLMVVDENRLLGVVTLKDMLKFLSLKIDLEEE